jgi:hypothetical protein
MSRWPALLASMWLLAAISPVALANETRALVLVTRAGGSDVHLSAPEIRRLFLGLPVARHEHPLIAVINQTDSLLYQVFLQKILFMSAPLYERQLLTNVVRQSGHYPHVYTDQRELLQALRTQPNTVTYMWRDQMDANSGLVVVTEIWQGRVN